MNRSWLIVLTAILILIIGALSYLTLGRRSSVPTIQPSPTPSLKIKSRSELQKSQQNLNKTDVDSLDRDAEQTERDAESF
jgi:hypothetical protein